MISVVVILLICLNLSVLFILGRRYYHKYQEYRNDHKGHWVRHVYSSDNTIALSFYLFFIVTASWLLINKMINGTGHAMPVMLIMGLWIIRNTDHQRENNLGHDDYDFPVLLAALIFLVYTYGLTGSYALPLLMLAVLVLFIANRLTAQATGQRLAMMLPRKQRAFRIGAIYRLAIDILLYGTWILGFIIAFKSTGKPPVDFSRNTVVLALMYAICLTSLACNISLLHSQLRLRRSPVAHSSGL